MKGYITLHQITRIMFAVHEQQRQFVVRPEHIALIHQECEGQYACIVVFGERYIVAENMAEILNRIEKAKS